MPKKAKIAVSVEKRGKRFRVMVGPRGDRNCAGWFNTREEALGLADALRTGYATPVTNTETGETVSLNTLAPDWFKHREVVRRLRCVDSDRYTWGAHVEPTAFANEPIGRVCAFEVQRHYEQKISEGMSTDVAGKCVQLIRGVLREAVGRGLLKVNPIPVREVTFAAPAATGKRSVEEREKFTFLEPEEIRAVLTCEDIPEPHRLLFAIAIFTGARKSELATVQWQDLLLDQERPEWVLCRGRKGPTKNGKVRRFELLRGQLLEGLPEHLSNPVAAFKWWADNSPYGTDPDDLVFPNFGSGASAHEKSDWGWSDKRWRDKRVKGNPLKVTHGWKSIALGEERRVRFHDLRHTCASALISGMFGRVWSPKEVQTYMGWRSPSMVERYAHLSGVYLSRAVAETSGEAPEQARDSHTSNHTRHQNQETPDTSGSEKPNDDGGFDWWAIADLNCGLPPCEESAPSNDSMELRPKIGFLPHHIATPPAAAFAADFLRAVIAGDNIAELRDQLAESVKATKVYRLATEIEAGGPTATAKAIELASLVLVEAQARAARAAMEENG